MMVGIARGRKGKQRKGKGHTQVNGSVKGRGKGEPGRGNGGRRREGMINNDCRGSKGKGKVK